MKVCLTVRPRMTKNTPLQNLLDAFKTHGDGAELRAVALHDRPGGPEYQLFKSAPGFYAVAARIIGATLSYHSFAWYSGGTRPGLATLAGVLLDNRRFEMQVTASDIATVDDCRQTLSNWYDGAEVRITAVHRIV